ncbi:MAG: response regulator [Endomicrobia bacterium]|nr:response regulator [Endomicrobiia bacterium]MCL2799535.1 response regulator [Endomicrobiia bacterium]
MEKKKILIVDDDAAFLDSAESILETKNFQIIKALSAESAYEALSADKPDLILLDVNLPDINGFEVLKTVKASKDFSNIPIILITGDMTVHVDKAFAEGADDCVFKPLDIDKLVLYMNRLLK